jgi:hypothetical protein
MLRCESFKSKIKENLTQPGRPYLERLFTLEELTVFWVDPHLQKRHVSSKKRGEERLEALLDGVVRLNQGDSPGLDVRQGHRGTWDERVSVTLKVRKLTTKHITDEQVSKT